MGETFPQLLCQDLQSATQLLIEGSMPGHDIIVLGASAGGVEVLSQLVRNLPADLPAALFIVLHFPAHGTSVLPKILSRAGILPAHHAQDGTKIQPGHIYVAPPDYHLLVKRGYVNLARGPKENSHRPAIDPLFRTAARAYGRRVVGVILSGMLDDGTAGLAVVKRQGGVALAQDPKDALYPSMPTSAIANVEVDHILPLAKMGDALVRLAHEPVAAAENFVSDNMAMEADMAQLDLDALQQDERPGTPSGFACPECGGVLWELPDGLLRFRCRVGHALGAESLLAEQSEAVEAALWSALRALEESTALTRRLIERSHRFNHTLTAQRYAERLRESEQNAALLRQLLLKSEGGSTVDPGATGLSVLGS